MTISEAAKKYELTPDTLRYYERIGLIPAVQRTASGLRDYDEEACRWVEFIKCMRSAGLPIEVLIEYVQLFRQGDATIAARLELLTEQRRLLQERIQAMQNTLARLDHKIRLYESGQMKQCEEQLNACGSREQNF